MRLAISAVTAMMVSGLLGGCAGPRTEEVQTLSPSTWSNLTAAAVRGPISLTVVGKPFASATDEAVAVAMSGWVAGLPVTYAVVPADASRADRVVIAFDPQPGVTYAVVPADASRVDRVVIAFDPQPGVTAADLCDGTASTMAGTAAPANLIAAFCGGKAVHAAVLGQADGFNGPGDPRFGQWLSETSEKLLRPHPVRVAFIGRGGGSTYYLR